MNNLLSMLISPNKEISNLGFSFITTQSLPEESKDMIKTSISFIIDYNANGLTNANQSVLVKNQILRSYILGVIRHDLFERFTKGYMSGHTKEFVFEILKDYFQRNEINFDLTELYESK